MLVEFAQLVAAAAPAEAMDVSHWSLLDIRSQSADEMGGVSDEVRKQLSSSSPRVLLVPRGNGPQHACLGGSAAALSVSGGGGASGGERSEGGSRRWEGMRMQVRAFRSRLHKTPQQPIRFDV